MLAFAGFVLTFLLSVGDNFFIRTVTNSFFSFIILFAAGYPLRWFLGTVAGLKPMAAETEPIPPELDLEEQTKGTAVDSITPEDDELNDLLKDQLNGSRQDSGFVPLRPEQLASNPASADRAAKALRRMTQEEGGRAE
jgi:hypothetical protein